MLLSKSFFDSQNNFNRYRDKKNITTRSEIVSRAVATRALVRVSIMSAEYLFSK